VDDICFNPECLVALCVKEVAIDMLNIKKEYLVTDDKKEKAVLIDIKTFEKIEEILESFGLGKYMEEVEDEDVLEIEEAKAHYKNLTGS
jgi:hypothetical protein